MKAALVTVAGGLALAALASLWAAVGRDGGANIGVGLLYLAGLGIAGAGALGFAVALVVVLVRRARGGAGRATVARRVTARRRIPAGLGGAPATRPSRAGAPIVSRRMDARLGLVALGDSITVGEGNMVCGTPCRSWALWLAEVLDLPFTGRAVNGAVVGDVEAGQLPRVTDDYDVGTLFVGVNDVRGVGWDADAFGAACGRVVDGLAARCARLLLVTAPLDLGRPPAGAKVGDLNAVVRRVAADAGAAVCALDDLAGWTLLMPDTVHPTALGQLEIAARAARALGASPDGRLPDRVLGPRGRASYARDHARMLARDVVRRRLEAVRS